MATFNTPLPGWCAACRAPAPASAAERAFPRRIGVSAGRGRLALAVPVSEHVFERRHPQDQPRGPQPVADQLIIRGAREHNLKDISLDLPRDSLIVFTGLSGSGKSSLAFDTILAGGHPRYVEPLPAAPRQFLGQMDKP